MIDVLGGGGRSGQLIPALVDLFEQGRFPFDRLVRYYEMGEIEKALADSKSGEVVKPILRIAHDQSDANSSDAKHSAAARK